MVGLPEKAYHGTPREGSGSLSMQPVGCTPWCSTDARMLLALGRSLMHNEKRMGPNMEPCRMPHLIFVMKMNSCLLIHIDSVHINSF